MNISQSSSLEPVWELVLHATSSLRCLCVITYRRVGLDLNGMCSTDMGVLGSYSDCIICAERTLWLICWLHIWSELVCLQRASLESVISFEDICLLTTQTLYRRLLGHGKALACCCIGSIIKLIRDINRSLNDSALQFQILWSVYFSTLRHADVSAPSHL
jgi:hypothetical protein